MITIGMAVLPNRIENLKISVPILAKQCDKMWLVINCDKLKTVDRPTSPIPEEITSLPNIVIKMNTTNEGDREKFFGMQYTDEGYYLTVDDDILYPEDYVSQHIKYLAGKDNWGITCVHASVFDAFKAPVRGFTGRRKMWHFTHENKELVKVLIPGTGTTCFNVKTFTMFPREMPTTNMGDIWISVKAASKGIPIYCIPRQAGWLKSMPEWGTAITRSRPTQEMDEVMEKNISHMRKMQLRLNK